MKDLFYLFVFGKDCHNVFALRVKQQAEDSNEKTFSFTITDESIEKSSYLHALHTQIVNISKTDDVSIKEREKKKTKDIIRAEFLMRACGD